MEYNQKEYMDEKSLNPVYFWLSENLFTEQTIAEQKKDLDSYALALSCGIEYPAKELKTRFALLYNELVKEQFKVKYVIASSILLYLSKKHRLHIKPNHTSQIKGAITSIHDMRLPFKYKMLTYYFSKQFDSSYAPQLEKVLISERDSWIQQDSFDDLIEVEFALGSKYFSKVKWDNFDLASSAFDIGKLSKLGLLYADTNDSQKVKAIINLVEKRVWEKISTTSLPTISLLVYEAEKLISTNMPTNELIDTLELLKKQNKDWAKLITTIQTDGITVDLKNFNHISGLSSEDICWSINLLKATDREKTYQLSSSEYKSFNNFLKTERKDALPVSRLSILFFTGFVSLILIFAYIYFVERHELSITIAFPQNINDWNVLWKSIKDTRISFETIGQIITSPPAVAFVTISTLWRSWLYLSRDHKFDVKYALKALLYVFEYK